MLHRLTPAKCDLVQAPWSRPFYPVEVCSPQRRVRPDRRLSVLATVSAGVFSSWLWCCFILREPVAERVFAGAVLHQQESHGHSSTAALSRCTCVSPPIWQKVLHRPLPQLWARMTVLHAGYAEGVIMHKEHKHRHWGSQTRAYASVLVWAGPQPAVLAGPCPPSACGSTLCMQRCTPLRLPLPAADKPLGLTPPCNLLDSMSLCAGQS